MNLSLQQCFRISFYYFAMYQINNKLLKCNKFPPDSLHRMCECHINKHKIKLKKCTVGRPKYLLSVLQRGDILIEIFPEIIATGYSASRGLITYNRVLATPGGGGRAHPVLYNFHLALLLILSLNTQHSSLKSCKINEESVLKGQLLSEFKFS